MSYLKERFKRNSAQIVRHRNSFIPQLEAKNESPIIYVSKHLKSYLITNYEINKVTVVDPYMTIADLRRITILFGGDAKNRLEIITKFQKPSVEEEEVLNETRDVDKIVKETKQERIQEIVRKKESLVLNGLFSGIDIFHPRLTMHDRYFIFWKEDEIYSIFSIGGSLGQDFGCFIQIQEILDSYHKDSVVHYYQMLKEKLVGEY